MTAPVASPETAPVDLARVVGALRELAPLLDESADPDGLALALLREHRMFGYLVPAELGGLGGDLAGALAVAQELGGACLAVAVLWVMHCQQTAIVREHAPEPLRTEVLRRVAAEQMLLGSVTTEPGKGGHVLTARAALEARGGHVSFHRDAPVVTGGAHAGAFLVTVRRSADAVAGDVVLVYCEREQSGAQVRGRLDMLGMRGTGNVRMTLDARVPQSQVIDGAGGFARITMRTLAPYGHLGWSACWIGAARDGLRRVVGDLRAGPRGRGVERTDAVHEALARVRCRLDAAEALVVAGLAEYRRHAATGGEGLEDTAFQILVNDVKVVASENTYAAVDALLELSGLGGGYQRGGLGLELLFRDLRSATLMYANQRLLQATGRLALMDRAATSLTSTGLASYLPRQES